MREARQLLFVQGGGEGTHDEWDDKLVESLRGELAATYEILYPRMPREAEPSYAAWKTKLESVFEKLRSGAVLVGHSIGGTILLKALSERTYGGKFAGVFLIAAPFVGDGGWPATELQLPSDLGRQLPHAVPIHFFHGLADETAPPSHLDLYRRAVPQAVLHRLPGRDHQLDNDLREVAAAISTLGKAQRTPRSRGRTRG